MNKYYTCLFNSDNHGTAFPSREWRPFMPPKKECTVHYSTRWFIVCTAQR